MRHFVTLIEICVHLIRVNPGHICEKCKKKEKVMSNWHLI